MAPLLLLTIIYIAFISLGLPDSVLGVTWPLMRTEWRQPIQAVGLITLPLTLFAAVSSFMSGALLQRLNTGHLVALSSLLTGFALLTYSYSPSFEWLVFLTIPLGLGAGAVDAALNHYVAENYSSRQMNWLHGFWGIGATVSPLIVGYTIALSGGWRSGYLYIGLVQIALGTLFICSLRLWRRPEQPKLERNSPCCSDSNKTVAYWVTWLAPFLYLVYTAIEVGTGLWLASVLIEQRSFPVAESGFWVSGFYGSLTLGRFVIGSISNTFSNRFLVRLGLLVALTGALLFTAALNHQMLALSGILLLGLGCAPIYPALMHEAPRRFNAAMTKIVIGRQVAFACIGAAFLPALFGFVASSAGISAIMPCVLLSIIALIILSEWLNHLT